MRWTEIEHKRLTCLAQKTRMSASQIGKELGKSRQAVIGRAYRFGIRLPNARGRPKATANRLFDAKPHRKRRAKPPLPNGRAARQAKLPVPKTRVSPPPQRVPPAPPAPIGGIDQIPGPDMTCCGAALLNIVNRTGLARSFCDHHLHVCRPQAPSAHNRSV